MNGLDLRTLSFQVSKGTYLKADHSPSNKYIRIFLVQEIFAALAHESWVHLSPLFFSVDFYLCLCFLGHFPFMQSSFGIPPKFPGSNILIFPHDLALPYPGLQMSRNDTNLSTKWTVTLDHPCGTTDGKTLQLCYSIFRKLCQNGFQCIGLYFNQAANICR